MFPSLDATNFQSSTLVYAIKFEDILSKIVRCYNMMVSDCVALENNENEIRDVLLYKYLKNNSVRQSLGFVSDQIHFESEVREDHSVGRTDLKIISPNIFEKQEAYYIIECKRLDKKYATGSSGLNKKYIDEGMFRFTSKYYSSYYRVNAMLGFVVDDMDIRLNTNHINQLLLDTSSIITLKKITQGNFINNFEYHYHSQHRDVDNEELKIYHLMLDFNLNIQKPK
ncbi:hypothetical protein [Colwellia sp. RSH04]|uniref:hypothetical protein n=1 Tax=Colwellia sp. RSH04 TaxID=2305464 RepID=UPI000E57E224|nr:hypothetical protein [Colwellia sp. RSH04]RHW75782.1 hypothetical protein D1094_11725 [Colwellia sp. RSH04]